MTMSLARCPWYVAGPLLGLLLVAMRATLNKPLGALGGYIDVAESGLRPHRLGFRGFLLFGLVLGGALFSLLTGHFGVLAYPAVVPVGAGAQLVVLLVAGIAMGFGARTAGGCTFGHGMSGMSLGSPASAVAAMTFFATAVAVALVSARLFGAAP
jgi:uncharacterized membrane protein YedE/YeeE